MADLQTRRPLPLPSSSQPARKQAGAFFDGDDSTWDDALEKLEAIEAVKEAEREAEQALIDAEEEATRQWELGTAESRGRQRGMARGVKVTLGLALTGFVVVVGTWVFAGESIKVNDAVPSPTSTGGFSVESDLIQPQEGVEAGSEAQQD